MPLRLSPNQSVEKAPPQAHLEHVQEVHEASFQSEAKLSEESIFLSLHGLVEPLRRGQKLLLRWHLRRAVGDLKRQDWRQVPLQFGHHECLQQLALTPRPRGIWRRRDRRAGASRRHLPLRALRCELRQFGRLSDLQEVPRNAVRLPSEGVLAEQCRRLHQFQHVQRLIAMSMLPKQMIKDQTDLFGELLLGLGCAREALSALVLECLPLGFEHLSGLLFGDGLRGLSLPELLDGLLEVNLQCTELISVDSLRETQGPCIPG
mmetsp:Transcript_90575/g.163426  ORF Transcript_90575/g.163426 Transcript_90575/m.163426 type:complete len:262 (-) Transcript_90575:1117-1902(-)